MMARKNNRLNHIIVAKEFFELSNQIAIIRIDNDPDMLDEANEIAAECKNILLSRPNFDGIVLIRRGRYNTKRSMDSDTYSSILERFIAHIRYTILKIKK